MGRIKTTLIKRTANKLFNENKNLFKSDFEENKKIVETLIEVQSKKIRNIIAGYLTRLARQSNKV